MKTAIATCATKSYCYALPALIRRLHANCRSAAINDAILILVGDTSKEFADCVSFAEKFFPGKVRVQAQAEWAESENYKPPVQLVIAQMRAAVVDIARIEGVDALWFLDSDVLPPDNALRCSLDLLAFDAGYYSVAFCPYPSQGGGSFLGGHGSPNDHILSDWTMEESTIPQRWKDRHAVFAKMEREHVAARDYAKAGKCSKILHMIEERVRKRSSPKGNVFALNAEKWRRRGWFDFAYPAIGKGAVVPIDWCGFGCTMLNRAAIDACDFSGYAGHGTEDLHVIWRAWNQRGLRIGCIPHCPVSHVVRSHNDKGKVVMVEAYHEEDGECAGHLRQRTRPWYNHLPGEEFREENDGNLYAPVTRA